MRKCFISFCCILFFNLTTQALSASAALWGTSNSAATQETTSFADNVDKTRFSVKKATLTDRFLGLEIRYAEDNVFFKNADALCSAIKAPAPEWQQEKAWRLPSVAELLYILNTKNLSAKIPNFELRNKSAFWSSAKTQGVYFKDNKVGIATLSSTSDDYLLSVMCVRGNYTKDAPDIGKTAELSRQFFIKQAEAESSVSASDSKVAPFPVNFNGQYGYVSPQGDSILTPRFEAASPFLGGCAIVRARGKYGIINAKGEWLLNPTLEKIPPTYKQSSVNTSADLQWEEHAGKRLLKSNQGNTVLAIDSICDTLVAKNSRDEVVWPQGKSVTQICEERMAMNRYQQQKDAQAKAAREAEERRRQAAAAEQQRRRQQEWANRCSHIYVGKSVTLYGINSVVLGVSPSEGRFTAIHSPRSPSSYPREYSCSDVSR